MNQILVLITTWICLASASQAAVIFSHNGAMDPTTEGFINSDPGIGVTTGPIIDDNGTGLDAWFVDDDSLVHGSAVIYRSSTLSTSAVTEALSSGWTLAVNLRVIEGPSKGFFDGLTAQFVTGSQAFGMTFDMESDNDPTVSLTNGTSFTLEGAGNQDYNLYKLVYDPLAGSADLFVNGTEKISDYGGSSTSAPAKVNWGGNASNGTGRGHFNSLEFAIIPEPSASLLVGLSLVVYLCRRRRTP